MTEGTLVIIQPTSFCNINCKYCYVSGRNNKKQMPIQTLDRIFEGVLGSKYTTDTTVFCYHAGEPLTMPKEFYRKANDRLAIYVEKYGRPAKQAIQTNAMLIDQEWVDIFKMSNMDIGVSLDGPSFIHDRYRVTRSFHPTHDKVMRGIKILQEAGLNFTAIMVLTSFSLDYPDEIYDFLVDNQIRFIGFNIDEFGANTHVSSFVEHSWDETLSRYKKFMERFIYRVDSEGGKLIVREFTKFATIATKKAKGEKDIFNGVIIPLDILTFDVEGNYITFSPELISAKSQRFDNLFMGNIYSQNLDQIFENERFKTIYAEIQEGVISCKNSCKYWGFCGGGAPADKFFETDKFNITETIACRVHMQALVDVFLDYMLSKNKL